jgi:hypothetical protein
MALHLTIFTLVPLFEFSKAYNPDKSDGNGLCGIALGSNFDKILDSIILHCYTNNLMSCELQFGFEAICSTNLCTMALKETGILLP